MLYFFLSYARGDDDPYVHKFYRELCSEIRALTGAGRDVEVGFFDSHSIDPGQRWSEKLLEALAECKTFIPLYSPAYFLSEPCGREWAIFARRTHNHGWPSDQTPPLIPLIWMPQHDVPEVVQPYQWSSDALGDVYNESGLRRLLRLQRNHDEYVDFVSAVANRVVKASAAPRLARTARVAFDDVPSAFHADPALATSAGRSRTGDQAAISTSQVVHFVVAAAAGPEVAAVRSDLRYYGPQPEDWAPYVPAYSRPLAEYACTVAAEKRFRSTVATIDQLNECINRAHRYNQIVVLLVDVWSTKIPRYHTVLHEYDGRNEPTTAVMIPRNQEDAETQTRSGELSEGVRQTFINNALRHDDVMFRSSVLTYETFGADLQVVLEVARNRVFIRGKVYRLPPRHGTPRPILEGP
jgi:FxsC-like protein